MMRLLYALALLVISSGLLTAQPEHTRNTCHHVNGFQKAAPLSMEQKAQIVVNNARSDTFDILHYEIHLDATDYDGQIIKANTIVSVSAKLPDQENIRLDLKDLIVDSVSIDGTATTFLHAEESLFVDLLEVAEVGDEMDISVWYGGHPYRDPQWGGFYFENNYIYNLGIGLSTIPPNFGRVWYPCFDVFVERATYEWHVKTADGFVTRGQGDFLGEQQLDGDTIIRTYAMDTPLPTYLAAIAAADYDSIGYDHVGANGIVPVELYCKEQHVAEMTAKFVNLGDAIDALEFWWGPNAWDRVGYVITTDGAMEHPTNIAYPQSTLGNSLGANEGLYSHELGHHWWGDMVSPEIHNHMWLKEGGAEYSQHLARSFISDMDAFRTEVKSNQRYVLEVAHIDDEGYWPLSPMPDEHIYGRHSYYKGASVWHNLRAYMGDELFQQGTAAVLDSFYLKTINPETFKNVLSWSTGVPLDDFFNDQVYIPGFSSFVLDSVVTTEEAGGYSHDLHIKQGLRACPEYYSNVPLDVTFIDSDWNRHVMQTTGDGSTNVGTLTTDFDPIAVFLNAEGTLNQARLDYEFIANDPTGPVTMPFVDMSVKVEAIEDSSLVRIEHHWIAPDPVVDNEEIVAISSTNYWTVSGVWAEGLHLEGKFDYNGATVGNLDFDLVGDTESDLGLVYRPDASEDWELYFDYSVSALNPSDGLGQVNVDSLLRGDYALANVDAISAIDESDAQREVFDIYPNPSDGIFHVQSDKAGRYVLSIYELDGRSVWTDRALLSSRDRMRIDISDGSAGIYILEIRSENGRLIGEKKIVVGE